MKKEISKTQFEKSVRVSKNGVFVSSDFVAEVFGKRHTDVTRSIENTQNSLRKIEESDSKYFKDSSYINSRGKEYKRFDLTRRGFDLIVLSFTGESALKYKVWFIDEFHKKTEFIHRQKLIVAQHESNDMWLNLRKESKAAREALTDAIKAYELPQRVAEGKASANFVAMRIINYTQMIYKTLGVDLPSGVNPRDALDPRKLFELESIEYQVARRIGELTEVQDCNYKQTYQLIKKELLC